MHIYLVRHGETTLNVKRAFYGVLDAPLTVQGHRQARQVGECLRGLQFDAVYTSSLVRTIDTAKDILSVSGPAAKPCGIRVLSGLDEMHFGCFEGLSYEEIREQFPQVYEAWSRDWLHTAPTGGENFIEFFARVRAAFNEILRENPDTKGNILICGHNGVMRVLFACMCQMSAEQIWHFNFEQGAWSRVDYEYENFTIRQINCTQAERAGVQAGQDPPAAADETTGQSNHEDLPASKTVQARPAPECPEEPAPECPKEPAAGVEIGQGCCEDLPDAEIAQVRPAPECPEEPAPECPKEPAAGVGMGQGCCEGLSAAETMQGRPAPECPEEPAPECPKETAAGVGMGQGCCEGLPAAETMQGRPANPGGIVPAAGTGMGMGQDDCGDPEADLAKVLAGIRGPHENIRQQILQIWDLKAKPLGSLGRLEEMIARLGAIYGTLSPQTGPKAVIVMAADHGVTEEGVAQTDYHVTTTVTDNMTHADATICILAHKCGAQVFPIDIGMREDSTCPGAQLGTDTVWNKKIRRGTRNMTKEPAMTRVETVQAIRTGIEAVRELKARGYRLFAAGEMGIGNTTAASAVASVLLDLPPEEVTGRGAGLSDEGYVKKLDAIRRAISLNQPDKNDMIDVLSKVGGLELAGLCGCYIGAAAEEVPIVLDGVISCAAALTAVRMTPACRSYLFSSICSTEPAAKRLLEAMDLKPYLDTEMHLGEGTGAVSTFYLFDLALTAYERIPTFEDIHIEAYQHL